MARNNAQSSFIPESDTLNPPGNSGSSRRGGGNYLVLISLGLLIVVILLAGGLFIYKQNLQSTLAERSQSLEQKRSAFDPGLINELGAVETRVNTAQTLVDNHLAFTPIFSVVESVTLSSVQFNEMEVSYNEAGGAGPQANSDNQASSGGVTVTLAGVGPGYATIALQSSELAEHDKIQNPVLSDFSLNNEGNVEFSVEFNVPEEEVLYKNTI